MALISNAVPLTFKGNPAQLSIIRNDGYCWGRLVVKTPAGLAESDVFVERDLYDLEDEIVFEKLERAAKRGKVAPPVASWRIGWSEEAGRG